MSATIRSSITLQSRSLYRYTSVPVLIDILNNRHITLLSPATWEDRNDAHYLDRYKAEKNLKTLLALCFTTSGETFHLWKVFASGSSGVCIEFDRNKLLSEFNETTGIRSGDVKYQLVSEVERKRPERETWPFLKRKPFRDEKEFRIIYENETVSMKDRHFSIDLASIRRITLSPWLPRSVAKSVTKTLKSIPGCAKMKIVRSSLLETSAWRDAIAPQPSGKKRLDHIVD